MPDWRERQVAVGAGMIVSPRVLLRGCADSRLQAEVLEWLNDQPGHRWHTLAEAVPNLPLAIDQLSRLWHQWVAEGWLEHRIDSGRSMFRPTPYLPIVSRKNREERLSWSDYFSALLELPVR